MRIYLYLFFLPLPINLYVCERESPNLSAISFPVLPALYRETIFLLRSGFWSHRDSTPYFFLH